MFSYINAMIGQSLLQLSECQGPFVIFIRRIVCSTNTNANTITTIYKQTTKNDKLQFPLWAVYMKTEFFFFFQTDKKQNTERKKKIYTYTQSRK